MMGGHTFFTLETICSDKAEPVVRRGRKTAGLRETAGLPGKHKANRLFWFG